MTLNEILISLEMGLIYGIVAIGVYFAFRIINFSDLTCDGSFVLGAATSSVLIQSGFNPWAALLLSIIAGGLSGFTTGVLFVWFKLTDLLAGILVAFMLYSINLYIMGGIPNIALINMDTIFNNMPALKLLIIIGLIIYILFSYLLLTDFGLALRSIGQNKVLAKNNGINVQFMTIIGLVLSNSLIALGGAVFSQHQGFSDIGFGIGTVIVGLISIMIGERILPYRSIKVQLASCLLGSIVYRLLIGFALHSEIFGLETKDFNLITGLIVIIITRLGKGYAKATRY
jgi:putative tryptophan/tyrosine transport system permease protein